MASPFHSSVFGGMARTIARTAAGLVPAGPASAVVSP